MNNKAVVLGLAVVFFLVAAALVIMIFRMLFGGRLRMPGGRARQARLGIVDAFDLDRQRQLIIVRRDNTEHLIMIGGPNDLVIESEIIRAEARDLRDTRREPGLASTASAGFAEGRIPAPAPALEPLPPAAEEPLLPMPPGPPTQVPNGAETKKLEPKSGDLKSGDPKKLEPNTAEAPRAPTFPLPPRRPAQQPERRPVTPPRLPDSVSRGDDIPALSGQPSAPAPAPPAPTPVAPPPADAAPLASPLPGPLPPTPPATAPARPPFLKPLTPRPPVRPLQRTTPQPAAPGAPPVVASAPPPAKPAAPQVAAAPPKPAPAPPPQKAPDSDPKDALESLEEEMAKLLGRGS